MKATEWAFDRIEEAFELVAQDEVARDHAQKHGQSAAHRRASRRTRRSHNVLFVPALQTASPWKTAFGGSAHNLVVCDLWREIQLKRNQTGF